MDEAVLSRNQIFDDASLQVDAYTVDTADPERVDVVRCELCLTSPVFGRLCGYEGSFVVERVSADEATSAGVGTNEP